MAAVVNDANFPWVQVAIIRRSAEQLVRPKEVRQARHWFIEARDVQDQPEIYFVRRREENDHHDQEYSQ